MGQWSTGWRAPTGRTTFGQGPNGLDQHLRVGLAGQPRSCSGGRHKEIGTGWVINDQEDLTFRAARPKAIEALREELLRANGVDDEDAELLVVGGGEDGFQAVCSGTQAGHPKQNRDTLGEHAAPRSNQYLAT
jgi:hypothetical protein